MGKVSGEISNLGAIVDGTIARPAKEVESLEQMGDYRSMPCRRRLPESPIGRRLTACARTTVSTTVMNSSSDDRAVMYSTSARSNVPVRLIGRLKINQTVGGLWVNNSSEITALALESLAIFST